MKFLLYDLLGRTYLLQYLTDTWSRFIRLQWWSIMWLITLQKIKFILISELTMCVFIDRNSFLLFLSSEFSSSLVFSTHQICWILLYSPQSDVSLKDAVCRFVLSSVVSRARLMYEPEIAHFFFFYVLRPSDMFHSTTICQCFPDLLSRRLAMPIHAAASVSLIFRVCCVFDSWGV